MTYEEFTALAKREISATEYHEVVEPVYTYHPAIPNKETAAKLYDLCGLQVFRDMKPMCVGGFLGFGLGMMLFALVMRPADEAGRKSDAERIRRLEGELQATSAKYREMANMMAYWRSRCIAYEKMLVERSRKAGAEK